ncbi:hypothetical protein L6164_027161 [Bauhinia variegata]|uniref:Uncharacterized protein n=1 Tax=Bauhinia variegata TaxID=167791 RepID=A0ACB9LS41_BAUVA|nr:hypothetical protein L6164_027161 [Bauhinia variegata]
MGGRLSSLDRVSKSPQSSRVLTFSTAAEWKTHFDSNKESDQLMVIDFFATWCGPCNYMLPIFNDFAERYKDVQFIRIDVDLFKEVAQEYQVEAMPTFVLIKKGKPIDRLVGARKDQLQKLIEKHKPRS